MKTHSAEGHRERLRQRFLQGGLDAFLDYEIVELLLTLGTPRKDCKEQAKELIEKFGSLKQVLDAPIEELAQVKGIGSANIFGLKLFQEIAERYSKERARERSVLDSPESVSDYLRNKISREKKEHFIVLSLDTKGNLIKPSDISVGTLSESLIHPREVFKEAVQSCAAGVIVAHNHPSGDPRPSGEDIAVTKQLKKSGKMLGIELLDHVIVSPGNFYSFKEHGLL